MNTSVKYQFKPPTIKEVLRLKTPQDIFDHITQHLLAQGRPAVKFRFTEAQSPSCVYRAHIDGNLCACSVGSVLPQSQWSEDVNEENLGSLLRGFSSATYAIWVQENFYLLDRMRFVHDNAKTDKQGRFKLERLMQDFRKVAHGLGLSMNKTEYLYTALTLHPWPWFPNE